MLEYLYVNNFRSLVNFKIEFQNISVLIGNNGTGKTAAFLILGFLKSFIAHSGRLTDCFKDSFRTRWMNQQIQTFELGLSDEESHYVYTLETQFNPVSRQCFAKREMLTKDGMRLLASEGGKVSVEDEGGSPMMFAMDPTLSAFSLAAGDENTPHLTRFKQLIRNMVVVTLNPQQIPPRAEREMILPDIQFMNLPAVYSFIMQTSPDAVTKICNQLRKINPSFDQIKMDMSVSGKEMLIDHKYEGTPVTYTFQELSEGERVLISLYTLLYGFIEKGAHVIIDEPDNFISIREIQPWCMAVKIACEEKGQCIMISHHPEVIDFFAKESGIWFSRLSSGETVLKDEPVRETGQDGFMKYSEIIAGGYLDEV